MNETKSIVLDVNGCHIECVIEYSVCKDPEDGIQLTGLVTVEPDRMGINISALLEVQDVYESILYMIEEIRNESKPIHPYWMTSE